MQCLRLIAATLIATSVAVADCASSSQRSSVPGGDASLVGTWKVFEARDGSETTRADAATFDYVAGT